MRFTDKRAALSAAFINRFAVGTVIGAVALPWPGWLIGVDDRPAAELARSHRHRRPRSRRGAGYGRWSDHRLDRARERHVIEINSVAPPAWGRGRARVDTKASLKSLRKK
jgi:hypothetical protein